MGMAIRRPNFDGELETLGVPSCPLDGRSLVPSPVNKARPREEMPSSNGLDAAPDQARGGRGFWLMERFPGGAS